MVSMVSYIESVKIGLWTLSKKIINDLHGFKTNRERDINQGLVVMALDLLDKVIVSDEADFLSNNNISHSDLISINTMLNKILELNNRPTFYLDKTNSSSIDCSSVCVPNPSSITLTDADGNIYQTAVICGKVWTTTNLKTTKYRDGTSIPNLILGSDWSSDTNGAYCIYDNEVSPIGDYGFLYNGYAVRNAKNIAPTGWHIPTKVEMDEMNACLATNQGGKLKSVGTTEWNIPNSGATNETAFSGLPSGTRGTGQLFYDKGNYTAFWTSTVGNNSWQNYTKRLTYNNNMFGTASESVNIGYPIRLVKD